LSIGKAKQFVVQNYGKVEILSCRNITENIELLDSDTLEGSGVEAFRHNLAITIARSPDRPR
jgi:hypothetical protein